MKSIMSIVVTLAVLIGGIFGVTFLTQYTRQDVPKTSNPKLFSRELIKLKEKTPEWDKVYGVDGYRSLEIEKGTKGHYDFLFSNVSDKPINVVREPQANCSCTNLSVSFGVVPDAEGTKLAALGFEKLPVGPGLEPYLANVQWKRMDAEASTGPSQPETLAGSQSDSPRFGAIRIEWEAVHIKPTTVKVVFAARQGSLVDYMPFELPITVCPPVIPSTDHLTVGDIWPGETKDAALVIWSPTRDNFDATAKMIVDDPCIEVSKPRKLTPEELKALPAALVRAESSSSISRTRCAYEIKVTAHESLGDKLLELGPLARRFIVNRGTDSELMITLTGTVRGPIEIGDKNDNDRIDFRVFKADRLAEKTVVIKSTAPNVTFSVDHVKPETLNVELKPIDSKFGNRSWNLGVIVPPDTQAGPFPNDSAIYLKTNSNPPRRIRIPVVGNASG